MKKTMRHTIEDVDGYLLGISGDKHGHGKIAHLGLSDGSILNLFFEGDGHEAEINAAIAAYNDHSEVITYPIPDNLKGKKIQIRRKVARIEEENVPGGKLC